MRTRIAALSLVVLLSAGAAAACNGVPTAAQDPVVQCQTSTGTYTVRDPIACQTSGSVGAAGATSAVHP